MNFLFSGPQLAVAVLSVLALPSLSVSCNPDSYLSKETFDVLLQEVQ